MIGVRATAQLAGLEAAAAKLRMGYATRVARQAADATQQRARQLAPKATTALAQSVSVQTADFSDYDLNADLAHVVNPQAELFAEPPTPPEGAATVSVGVTYGAYVNGGTIHQPARPFFDTARFETEIALGFLAEQEWRKP